MHHVYVFHGQGCNLKHFSDRSGREDKRAAYGTLAQEMMAWRNQFQHIRDKDIIIVGTLGQYLDDWNRSTWQPQCEGAKTTSEIPGIVDEVISMVGIKKDDGTDDGTFVWLKNDIWANYLRKLKLKLF
nr:AAA family ATPase [Wolbachia endosymbiont of Atemnus politus]